MAVDSNSYEEIRKRRIEENRKHFQNLGITKISKDLTEATQKERKQVKIHRSPNPKKVLEPSELRRSSRARNTVTYNDDGADDIEIHLRRARKSKNGNPDRAYRGRVASYEETARAVKRAEILKSRLEYPSFVKAMVRSHVSSCFWLGLPSKFCKDNLPLSELSMVLEDEKGDTYDAVYIGKRTGLSGGWRGFAIDHDLEDGDVLVFELTDPTTFKVYIVKAIEDEPDESADDQTVPEVNSMAAAAAAAENTIESVAEEEDQVVSQNQPTYVGRKTRRKRKM